MTADFKAFRGLGLPLLCHSAKGTTWKEHKYIKRLNGTYYYPDSYEGGRHLSDSSNTDDISSSNDDNTLSPEDIEKLAMEVIRGNFGDGQIRKDLLGDYYQQVQNRVNEIYRGKAASTKMSDVSEKDVKEGKTAIDKAVNSSSSKGLDYEKIYAVYRKKK